MPGLLPHVDPDGLLEYSVVYTDRSLNHMSKDFHTVMRDISRLIKEVYHAHSAVLVPGSGTFGMEAVARQFATDKPVLVLRNGWFSYRWTQLFDMGRIPSSCTVLKARRLKAGAQEPFSPAPIAEVVSTIAAEKPAVVFAPHVETSWHDVAQRLFASSRRRGARGGWLVCVGLHCLGRHVGGHASLRHRRVGDRPPKGLEQFAVLRHGGPERARPPSH